MKNVIIGTAGHVDHGKTALIKALTGIDTDRLEEEKKRGITIELGFAHLDFDDGTQAGIIDVPGHEKFIRNMLAGAGGVDLAMLIVAADEGIMPQTAEHLGILTLLGIRDGLVVVTKTDLVEDEWLEMVMGDVKDFVKGTFLDGKPVIPVSVYTGAGLEELKECLRALIDGVAEKNVRVPFRLPVDRVFPVGSLIIGEAAVNAGIVGAPMVIIIALTAVSSFIVPNLAEFILIYRLFFLFLGAVMGLIGIGTGVVIMLAQLISTESFGVPILSTFSRNEMKDSVFRFPLWSMKFRPESIAQENVRRMK